MFKHYTSFNLDIIPWPPFLKGVREAEPVIYIYTSLPYFTDLIIVKILPSNSQ